MPLTISWSPASSTRSIGGLRLELAGAVGDDRHHVDAPAGEVGDGLAGERAAGGDLDLLDRERELAVRQREVDEVGDARPRGELRDLAAGARVRRDDAVARRPGGACASEPSSFARATMNSFGLSERAESVT